MTEATEERPLRTCTECGIEDTDPRHEVATDDGTEQSRHMDCCSAAGCPDGTCDELNPDGLTGDELLAHLTGSE